MNSPFAKWAVVVVPLCFAASAAGAEDVARLFYAPSAKVLPQPKMAVLFAFKLTLPEGRGLARLLLDAGVNQDDAASAARLAAGHLGDGIGGCDAKVEVSQGFDGKGLRLERVELSTPGGNTTIERRQGKLTIASQQGPRTNLRLV